MDNVFTISLEPTFRFVRRYRYRLYRTLPRRLGLALEKWHTDRLYGRLIRNSQDHEERRSLHDEHYFELHQIEDARADYMTDRVLRQADRLYIPKPSMRTNDKEGFWEQSSLTGKYQLTRKGIAKVREDIRQERKARREPWVFWLTAVSGWLALLLKVIAG